MFKHLLKLATVLVTAVAVACAGTIPRSSASVATRTLSIWWYENPGQPNVFGMQAALKLFEQQHPGVQVHFQQKTFNQMQDTGKQILGSSVAPDVLEYNKGVATLGIAARAGLLTDLTQIARRRGWTKLGLALDVGKVDLKTGLTPAVNGNLYGIPIGAEFLRVFYNKNMLAKAGLTVPTSFTGFEVELKKFAQRGITPISLGAGDYPTVHILYEVSLVKATPQWVANYQGLKRPIDFQQDPVESFGANTIASWVKSGYISKNATGVNPSDMVNDFVNQKMPFMISGTWQDQLVQSGAKGKFQWGTFLLPGSGVHEGDPTNIFVVPANATNKDLAYDYISDALSKGPQDTIGNTGGVPVVANPADITNPVGREATSQYQVIVRSSDIGWFPDWPAAGYYNQLLAAGQALIGGSITPDQYLNQIQGPYNRAVQQLSAGQ